MTTILSTSSWDAGDYARVGGFVPALGAVLTGDTLFQGGPGATGRSYSDKPTLVASIREKLFTLPGDTVVLTGHGDSTTLAAEEVGLEDECPTTAGSRPGSTCSRSGARTWPGEHACGGR